MTKKTVNSTSKKINKLEEDKQKLFKKLMTKIKIQEKQAAEDIVDNVKTSE